MAKLMAGRSAGVCATFYVRGLQRTGNPRNCSLKLFPLASTAQKSHWQYEFVFEVTDLRWSFIYDRAQMECHVLNTRAQIFLLQISKHFPMILLFLNQIKATHFLFHNCRPAVDQRHQEGTRIRFRVFGLSWCQPKTHVDSDQLFQQCKWRSWKAVKVSLRSFGSISQIHNRVGSRSCRVRLLETVVEFPFCGDWWSKIKNQKNGTRLFFQGVVKY